MKKIKKITDMNCVHYRILIPTDLFIDFKTKVFKKEGLREVPNVIRRLLADYVK